MHTYATPMHAVYAGDGHIDPPKGWYGRTIRLSFGPSRYLTGQPYRRYTVNMVADDGGGLVAVYHITSGLDFEPNMLAWKILCHHIEAAN